MDCTRCGHPYSMHTLGSEHRCRMRIAYGWDEQRQAFTGTAPCRCFAYRGRRPGDDLCPHEYVKSRPGCVACGHVPTARERSV